MMSARWHTALAGAAAALACAAALAQSAEEREIGHLLDYVARPDCEFNRNGSWHSGQEARAHLQKKYDYLKRRKQAADAETFIRLAASASSMSGKPYQVRCAGMAPVPSGAWLEQELQRYRAMQKGSRP